MRKNLTTILIFTILLPLLSGCWDRVEVTDLSIAVALGIDKNDNGEFEISVQVLNPSENAANTGDGSGYDTPVTTYSATGHILFEASRKLTTKTPSEIYMSHLRIIVVGEEVAKEGIYDVLDVLSRDPEVRTDFYVLIAREHKAKDILGMLTSISKIPANKMFNALNASADSWAATGKKRLHELMDEIVSDGIQPTLTGIKVEGDPKAVKGKEDIPYVIPNSIITFNGTGVFKKNKLVGWLTEEESKGLNYVKDNVESTAIVFKQNDDFIGIELIKSKTEITPKIRHGVPSITVKISGDANVAEVNTKIDLSSPSVIAQLEKQSNKDVKDIITKTVHKAQKDFKSDIFGFGKAIHKNDPKAWVKLKDKWSDTFPDITVNIDVDIHIRREGTINNPFHNELGEE
ncbi:MAG TPA: Ger(x)C family spore germination protein [Bacillaceae bacterium]|nr:Ger(x)C family spore germination protein [Bacillaceae bacterium]